MERQEDGYGDAPVPSSPATPYMHDGDRKCRPRCANGSPAQTSDPQTRSQADTATRRRSKSPCPRFPRRPNLVSGPQRASALSHVGGCRMPWRALPYLRFRSWGGGGVWTSRWGHAPTIDHTAVGVAFGILVTGILLIVSLVQPTGRRISSGLDGGVDEEGERRKRQRRRNRELGTGSQEWEWEWDGDWDRDWSKLSAECLYDLRFRPVRGANLAVPVPSRI